eukprot:m.77093 g.77093  ORF g.77093 m.77093 type:complete len:266 (-) comp7906_c0_seq1:479-1276(-)
MADVGHSKKGKTHKAAGQGPSKRRRLKKAYEAGLDDTCDVELDLAGLDDPLDLHVAALAELRAGNSSVAKSMLDVALARVGNLDKAKLSQRERGVYSLCLLERGTLIDDPVWEHVEEAIQELQPLVKELRDLGKPLDSLQQSFVLALLRAQAFAVTHAEDEAAQRAALASAITTCDTARVLHLDGADVSLAFAGALLADEGIALLGPDLIYPVGLPIARMMAICAHSQFDSKIARSRVITQSSSARQFLPRTRTTLAPTACWAAR